MFKLPGNMGDLLQQAQKLQQDFQRMQEDAASVIVESSAGGGMVTCKINGLQEIVSLTIDKSVVDPNDIEMLQDLVRAAVNEGVRKSKESMKGELSKLTGGLPIPGFS